MRNLDLMRRSFHRRHIRARQIILGQHKDFLYLLPMRLSHLNALRALEASLRHRSFTEASHELGVTPAAVGQRVRSLEDYLNVKLFIRTKSGIDPTDDALRVEKLLNVGFSDVATALRQLKQSSLGTHLAITLPASFAEHWLTPWISEFYRRHEELDLRLDASNRDVDLVTENFDFAIRYGRQTTPPLEEKLLFGDFVLPICSPSFQKQWEIGPETSSLNGVPLIHVDNRTSDPGWVGFDSWGEAFGFDQNDLSKGVRYSSVSSGLKAAVEGQGLVLSGMVEAYNLIKAGQLAVPFGYSKHCKTHYAYRLVWLNGTRQTALGRDFADWLMKRAHDYSQGVDQLMR